MRFIPNAVDHRLHRRRVHHLLHRLVLVQVTRQNHQPPLFRQPLDPILSLLLLLRFEFLRPLFHKSHHSMSLWFL